MWTRAVVIEIAKTASLTISNKNVQYRQVLKTLKGKMMLCKMTGRRGESKSWAKSNSCHVLNNILKNQRKNRVSAIDLTHKQETYWPIQFHHYLNKKQVILPTVICFSLMNSITAEKQFRLTLRFLKSRHRNKTKTMKLYFGE